MHAVCSTHSAPSAASRVKKTLKEAEARRMARVKTLGKRVAMTLKDLDREARDLFVQDVRDLAEVAAKALDNAEQPPAADS